MFKIGDRVKFRDSEGSGNGIAVVTDPDYKKTVGVSHYDMCAKIVECSKVYHKGETWYFPYSHIEHEYVEIKYDPDQMVSDEDDL